MAQQFTPHWDLNGTSNITGLLFPHQLQAIRMIVPRDMEIVFGPGIDIDIPSKGYTDPEWYFKTSDGIVFGIGWRNGHARLRGRGKRSTSPRRTSLQLRHPTQAQATAFVDFLIDALRVS
jgi:hypothetical protein